MSAPREKLQETGKNQVSASKGTRRWELSQRMREVRTITGAIKKKRLI